MELSELRSRLRARVGNPSQTDIPDTPNLDQYINDAYQEIFNKYKSRRRRARARFTTTIGQDKYNLAGTTDVVYKVWDRTNGLELEYIGISKLSEKDYDASPNNLVQNAKPLQWTVMETYLQLLPPPDGAYVIEFVYKVIFSSLVQPTDIPVVPEYWHRGIVMLASAIYYEDAAGDQEKAAFHRGLFKDWVSDLPLEAHEQTEAIDSGVEVPTLGFNARADRKPDGIWWDILD